MKITKIDNIHKANSADGFLYDNNTSEIKNITEIVNNRIQNAAKSAEELFSIFKRIKNPKKWQSDLNEYIKCGYNGEFKTTDFRYTKLKPKDIEKSLKEPFEKYNILIFNLLHNRSDKTINYLKKDLYKDIIKETDIAKKRILSKDCNSIEKSIQNQKCNFCIENNKIRFIDSKSNKQWLQMLGIEPKGNVLENMKKMFTMLENNFFTQVENGNYKDMRQKLFDNIKAFNSNPDNNIYFKFWVRKAYDTFTETYFKSKNDLKISEVNRKIKGKLKSKITCKLLEYGKIIYHFTDNEGKVLFQDYTITSFDMEAIKAKETISEKVNTSLLHAISNFAFAINANVLKDDFLLKRYPADGNMDKIPEHFKNYCKFFGGRSNFIKEYCDNIMPKDNGYTYINQTKHLLYSRRNAHFHYEKSNDNKITDDKILELYNKECELQGGFIKEKYLSNEIDKYFRKDELDNLIKDIHKNKPVVPAPFLPSFRRLKSNFGEEYKSILNSFDNKKKVAFNFLLQNIYYNKFLSETNFNSMLIKIESIKPQKNENDKGFEKAFIDFKKQFNQKDNLNALAEKLQIETMQANSKNKTDTKHKGHYDILLRKLVANGFWNYIKLHYKNVLELNEHNEKYKPTKEVDLTDLVKKYKEVMNKNTDTLLGYYVIAKFLPPKELNALKGDFTKYNQFIKDICLRCKSILNNVTPFIIKTKQQFSMCDDIITVLSVCVESSGRISQCVRDYYNYDDSNVNVEENDYAKTLGYFLDPPVTTFEELKQWQLNNIPHNPSKEAERNIWKKYVDDNHPIIFSQIERSRQNGTFEIIKKIYDLKIQKQDFEDICKISNMPCFNKFHDSAKMNYQEHDFSIKYIFEKNKVELYNIQKLNDLLIDLFINLVSWCYMWERDLEYIMLAFAEITGKSTEEVKKIFIFEKSSGTMGKKLNKYENSYYGISELLDIYFLKDKKLSPNLKRKNIRNQIDHWHYFRNPPKHDQFDKHELLEYYTYFKDMLSYSPKLKNNVFQKLLNTLDSYHIEQKWGSKLFTFHRKNNKNLYTNVTMNKNILVPKKAEFEYSKFKKSVWINGHNKSIFEKSKKQFPLFDKTLLKSVEKMLLIY